MLASPSMLMDSQATRNPEVIMEYFIESFSSADEASKMIRSIKANFTGVMLYVKRKAIWARF